MILLVGPGRPRRRRARGLPGARLRAPCSGRWRSGSRRSTTPPASRSSSRAPSPSRRPGGPGPVVLALPEDMLTDVVDVPDAAPHRPLAATPPGDAAMARLAELLEGAERPLAIVGEGGWTSRTGARRRGVLRGAAHPRRRLVPLPGLRRQPLARLRRARRARRWTRRSRRGSATPTCCWRSAGAWARSRPTATRSLRPPAPAQRLVHVHPDPGELGAVYQPELGIACDLEAFAAAAAELAADGRARGAARGGPRRVRAQPARGRASSPARCRCPPSWRRCASGSARDAILTNGAGNFSIWAHRYYEFRRYRTQLAPRSGSMGYGVPAAVAAKAVHPERAVVCIAGDGDFLMTGQELATAVQEDLPIVVLVVNNGMYGTIRMHQERRYPGRVFATDLRNPDFAAYARAFGAHGALVERTEDVGPALDEALDLRAPGARRAARRPAGDHAARHPGRDPRGGGAMMNATEIAAGAVSPVEAVEDALARIEAQRELRAVITLCGDEALARARGGVRGRLAGVPLLVKDLIDTAGIRTTYASSLYAEHVPERTAPSVAALEAEGAIVVGKANADEFAWGTCGQNTFYGDPVNPTAPDRIAGGSSSGNAVALAAGHGAARRSGPTPAGPCGCRPAPAGSSGSRPRSARCPSRASSRSSPASTRSGPWRGPSPTARSRTPCSPARRSPSRGCAACASGCSRRCPISRRWRPPARATTAPSPTRSACARSAPTCRRPSCPRRRATRGRCSTPRRRGRTRRRSPAAATSTARRSARSSTARCR